MTDFCGCGRLIPCKAHPQFRIITDDHGDRWQITQTPLADEWPAGDPCPTDREWLCHITKVTPCASSPSPSSPSSSPPSS